MRDCDRPQGRPIGSAANEEEMEKRLASKLMAGEPFIAIDNCTRPLGGESDLLDLTQERVSPRILGFSKAPPISTGAFVAANGNNLVIKGDLIRRTMLCRIDAKVEQPETRVFDVDPVAEAVAKRARAYCRGVDRSAGVSCRAPGKKRSAWLV